MRNTFLTVTILMFTFPVFACPDLTGEYLCKEQNGQEQSLVLILNQKNGVATLYDQADEYTLDGNKHSLTWEMLNGFYVGTCTSQQISVEIEGEIFIDGVKIGDMTLVDTYLPKDKNTIQWSSRYKRIHPDGSTYVSDESWECLKN